MISKKAKETIQDHGYYLSSTDQVLSFKPSRATAYGLIAIMVFMMSPGLILIFHFPLVGLIMSAIVFLFFSFPIRNRLKRKSLALNPSKKRLFLGDESCHFLDISEINYNSEFISEYTSAYKKTNKEYHMTLRATAKNGRKWDLLVFRSDYPEPSEPMKEIASLIRNTALTNPSLS